MRDLAKELKEWGEWPPAWRPEPDDVLVGKVVRYGVGPTARGLARNVIMEQDGGAGCVTVWLISTVLLNLFAAERPRVGERVGIRYLGKHLQRNYHRYALLVDRPEAEPEFTPLGGEQEAEPGGLLGE